MFFSNTNGSGALTQPNEPVNGKSASTTMGIFDFRNERRPPDPGARKAYRFSFPDLRMRLKFRSPPTAIAWAPSLFREREG